MSRCWITSGLLGPNLLTFFSCQNCEWILNKHMTKLCIVSSEQQQTIPEKKSAGGPGEVQQHHQHSLHSHPEKG